ncbi:hypothetical protein [Methanosphaera sp.]
MIKCPNCGYTNQDTSSCVICGQELTITYIQNNEQENIYDNFQQDTNTYNQYENPEYNNPTEYEGDNYDYDNQQDLYNQQIYTHKKSKALVFILTLILPGFGQIYVNGDILKGIVLFILCFTLKSSDNIFLLLLWFIIYIYTLADALIQVDRYNEKVEQN